MSEKKTMIATLYERTVQELMEPVGSKQCLVEKSDDIDHVFRLLSNQNHLWVVDDIMTGHVVGVITLSDTIPLLAPALTPLQSFDTPAIQSFQFGVLTKAEEMMSSRPITAEPTETIAEVITKMKQHKIKQLPVVDQDKRLIGEITLGRLIQEYRQRQHKSTSARKTETSPKKHRDVS